LQESTSGKDSIKEEFMSLSNQDRTAFVNAFTRIVITAWSDDDFARQLDSDPGAALRENGLDIPADAEINVVRQFSEDVEGSLDTQVALWERGLATNVYEFHIPDTPQIDTAELTEGDLSTVAAGGCCCCPCTCFSIS